MRIRIHLFTVMRIRSESDFLLQCKCGSGSFSKFKEMRIRDHWSTGPSLLQFEPPRLDCERPRLRFEPLKLLSFDFNADPEKNLWGYGSGYTLLIWTYLSKWISSSLSLKVSSFPGRSWKPPFLPRWRLCRWRRQQRKQNANRIPAANRADTVKKKIL